MPIKYTRHRHDMLLPSTGPMEWRCPYCGVSTNDAMTAHELDRQWSPSPPPVSGPAVLVVAAYLALIALVVYGIWRAS